MGGQPPRRSASLHGPGQPCVAAAANQQPHERCVPLQRSAVGHVSTAFLPQRFQEIASQPFLLPFVKVASVSQTIPRRRQDEDCHLSRLRSCFLAVSQSMKDSLPCLTRSFVSRRISPCHFGDSNLSSSMVSSFQSDSIARSFSAV